MDIDRHQCQALEGQLGCYFGDLFFMKQQFTRSRRRVIYVISVRIGRDIAPDQPNFAVFVLRVGFVERTPAVSEAFDLGAGEDDAALEILDKLELETGFFVSDGWGGFFFRFCHNCLACKRLCRPMVARDGDDRPGEAGQSIRTLKVCNGCGSI